MQILSSTSSLPCLSAIPLPAAVSLSDGRYGGCNDAMMSVLSDLSEPGGLLADRVVAAIVGWLEHIDLADADEEWRPPLEAWLWSPSSTPLILDLPGQRRLALNFGPVVRGSRLLLLEDRSEMRQLTKALRLGAVALEVKGREHRLAIERARAAAERAERSKMRFFAAASHDLLQPINAARIFASALADRCSLDPEISLLSERIGAALDSAEEVIDVLVDATRLQSPEFKSTIQEFRLSEVLDGLVLQYRSIAERRGLQLRLRAADWVIRSDPRLLRRVLQNLLVNALRYTASGGVLVGARRRGSRISIDVWDTGVGIPEERIDEVFEEFRRGHVESPWGEKGLGLGLSICMSIAKLLGHPLRVASTPGRGSVFSIAVDCLERTGEVSVAAQEHEPVVRSIPIAGDLTLLCVDNDIKNIEALSTLLRGWGVRFTGVTSATAALAHCRTEHPQVLLADFHLDSADGLDGLDLCLGLRSSVSGEPGPLLVLLTATRDQGLNSRCASQNIHVLHKPLRASRLRALLEAYSTANKTT